MEATTTSLDRTQWYCFSRPRPKFRGSLHGIMFVTSPLWSAYMLYQCCTHEALVAASFPLFAAFFQFGASALYHQGNFKHEHEDLIGKLDFIAISLMIAYSISPVYALLLDSGWKVVASSTVFASMGAGCTLVGVSKPLRLVIYLLQGAISSIPITVIHLSSFEICALAVTVIAYVSGALIYTFEYPDPFPNHFGYHELWHQLIVIAAMGTYFTNMSVIERSQLTCLA